MPGAGSRCGHACDIHREETRCTARPPSRSGVAFLVIGAPRAPPRRLFGGRDQADPRAPARRATAPSAATASATTGRPHRRRRPVAHPAPPARPSRSRAEPPAATLAVEGGDPVAGQLGSFTWNGGGSDSPWLPGAPTHRRCRRAPDRLARRRGRRRHLVCRAASPAGSSDGDGRRRTRRRIATAAARSPSRPRRRAAGRCS